MRSPAPLTEDDPTHAGSFRLLGRLATGGMGRVYLARRDDRPDSLVALKMMRPELASDPVFRDRFVAEVAASRRLAERGAEGTHVARAVDADASGSQPWLATEYVPGPSAAEAVARGPLPAGRVVEIARALAEALEALHAEGLVHGDLKPTNVVLGPDGVRLVDLGLARDHTSPDDDLDGRRLGSPGWSAPEMTRGQAAGTASDVHGWGMTVAYCATGRPAFGTGTPDEVHARMAQGAPDLDGVPDRLRPLVASALATDPAQRPSAADLAAALNADTAVDAGEVSPTVPVLVSATAPLVAPTLMDTFVVTEETAGRRRGVLAALAVAAATLGLVALAALALAMVGSGSPAPAAAEPSRTPSSATAAASSPTTAAPSPTRAAATIAKTGATKAAAPAPAAPHGKAKGHKDKPGSGKRK